MWVKGPSSVLHPLVAAACLKFHCSTVLLDKAVHQDGSFLLLLCPDGKCLGTGWGEGGGALNFVYTLQPCLACSDPVCCFPSYAWHSKQLHPQYGLPLCLTCGSVLPGHTVSKCIEVKPTEPGPVPVASYSACLDYSPQNISLTRGTFSLTWVPQPQTASKVTALGLKQTCSSNLPGVSTSWQPISSSAGSKQPVALVMQQAARQDQSQPYLRSSCSSHYGSDPGIGAGQRSTRVLSDEMDPEPRPSPPLKPYGSPHSDQGPGRSRSHYWHQEEQQNKDLVQLGQQLLDTAAGPQPWDVGSKPLSPPRGRLTNGIGSGYQPTGPAVATADQGHVWHMSTTTVPQQHNPHADSKHVTAIERSSSFGDDQLADSDCGPCIGSPVKAASRRQQPFTSTAGTGNQQADMVASSGAHVLHNAGRSAGSVPALMFDIQSGEHRPASPSVQASLALSHLNLLQHLSSGSLQHALDSRQSTPASSSVGAEGNRPQQYLQLAYGTEQCQAGDPEGATGYAPPSVTSPYSSGYAPSPVHVVHTDLKLHKLRTSLDHSSAVSAGVSAALSAAEDAMLGSPKSTGSLPMPRQLQQSASSPLRRCSNLQQNVWPQHGRSCDPLRSSIGQCSGAVFNAVAAISAAETALSGSPSAPAALHWPQVQSYQQQQEPMLLVQDELSFGITRTREHSTHTSPSQPLHPAFQPYQAVSSADRYRSKHLAPTPQPQLSKSVDIVDVFRGPAQAVHHHAPAHCSYDGRRSSMGSAHAGAAGAVVSAVSAAYRSSTAGTADAQTTALQTEVLNLKAEVR